MSASDNRNELALAGISALCDVALLLLDADAAPVFATPSACRLLGQGDISALRGAWSTLGTCLGLRRTSLPRAAEPLQLAVVLPAGSAECRLRLQCLALGAAAAAGWLVLLEDEGSADSLIHDLRTPLNAMQITLELLAGDQPDGSLAPDSAYVARQQRCFRILQEELMRLNQLLRHRHKRRSDP